MIRWIKEKMNQRKCNHADAKRWTAPTILTNGKLATLVIKECKDCRHVFSHIEAYDYGRS